MRYVIFLAALGIVTAPAVARAPLGVFFRWGAFEALDPRSCYAIAAAAAPSAGGAEGSYASVAVWPEGPPGAQFYARLSRSKRAGSAVILRIDKSIFQLAGQGRDAWAPSDRADAAIVAAMRTGVAMTVESRSQGGARIRDRYVLRGAASAIDSAIFACAGPGR